MKEIIKFSASWCQPCKQFAPIFNEVSQMEEFEGVTFTTIDVDNDENDLVEKYNIRGVPSIVMLDENNNVMKIITGLITKNQFMAILNEYK